MLRKPFLLNLVRCNRNEKNISTCVCLKNDILKSKRMQKLLAKQKDIKVGHMRIKVPHEKVAPGPKPYKTYRKITVGIQKRLQQMAAVYQEHMTQIIADGEVDINVDIVEVQVMHDMGSINVYWEGSDDFEKDNARQQHLDQQAGSLRHALHSRNFLGYIPKIVFVKNLSAAKEKKLDEIFERLNLDAMLVPEDYSQSTAEVKNGDKFRQDVYGLQHDALMQKVTDAKQGRPTGAKIVEIDITDDLMTNLARKEYVQKFSKHLKGKKIDQKKERRIREYLAQSYLVQDDD